MSTMEQRPHPGPALAPLSLGQGVMAGWQQVSPPHTYRTTALQEGSSYRPGVARQHATSSPENRLKCRLHSPWIIPSHGLWRGRGPTGQAQHVSNWSRAGARRGGLWVTVREDGVHASSNQRASVATSSAPTRGTTPRSAQARHIVTLGLVDVWQGVITPPPCCSGGQGVVVEGAGATGSCALSLRGAGPICERGRGTSRDERFRL